MINVFIGYDPKEISAYHVLSHSIMKNSSEPVAITPVALNNLDFNRKRNVLSSTEFSFSRFLVPSLMNYEGWALFMDCDMLMTADIAELWALRDARYAVQVCKHDYTPKNTTKFLGHKQTVFPKKNWSSFMLMNCEKCKALTKPFVEQASGLELHQYKWLASEDLIGSLPLEWNWLAEEYEWKSDVKNIHYTEGGPWFKEYATTDYAEDWFKYYREVSL